MHHIDDAQANLHIAIIGMALRFPGADNPAQFWDNLRDGVESIATFTDADLLAAGVDPAELRDPNYVRMAPILDDIEHFDAAFFGYTPAEAELIDPQQRIFLECSWEALEQAGYSPRTFDGSIGVFAGSRTNSYLYNIVSNPELFKSTGIFQISVGNDLANLATRISFKLNLKGPSYGIHTACSTSLVAVHLARQSLLMDECQIAIAGGVAVNVPHRVGYVYQEGGILAPDGHCRAFDARAAGTIFGSGAGVVVLKRLADALADGDTIHAVIRGTATNNDGSVKASFTAPSVDGQLAVILDALAEAELRPDDISYIETHGTGTALGDPIEMRALARAFRGRSQKQGKCAIGSVKTNLGHLDAAAGISSLIKTVLALQHRRLPPSLHYEAPNPRIDFAGSPFYVNTRLAEWQARGPRRAGVSSFGFGGTNAHVIVEESPSLLPSDPAQPWQLLALSARSQDALGAMVGNLASHLAAHPELNLADVAYTLQLGRQFFEQRCYLICRDHAGALAGLQEQAPGQIVAGAPTASNPPLAFMFSGQGAQYVGMGRELYQTEPVFREQLDRCAELLQPHLGLDLREVLYPADDRRPTTDDRRSDSSPSGVDGQWSVVGGRELEQTQYAQPALFVVEYALAQLWMSWGVRPQALIGHSIGEYVAACLAGVFSLEDALKLVAARGRLMQAMPEGAMLAVPLPKEDVYPLLDQSLSLAAVNGPALCVVAGPTEAVAALEQRLINQELQCRRLHTSHAFHSAMMEPILEPFAALLRQVALNAPQTPLVSNLTGTWLTDQQATDPTYWAQHLRRPVRFAEGLQTLFQTPGQVLLEIGPGSTLSTFARQQPGSLAIIQSLRHPNDQRPDRAMLLGALGQLWLAGTEIDWGAVWGAARRRRIPLPTYPFERRRYWIDPAGLPMPARQGATLGKKAAVAEWFYLPGWQAVSLDAARGEAGRTAQQERWLVFADDCGLGSELVARLDAAQQEVLTIRAGERFEQLDEHTYTIDPRRSEDYTSLIAELQRLGRIPTRIAHLWSITPDDRAYGDVATFEAAQDLGFYSLLFLAQALGKARVAGSIHIGVVSNHLHGVTGDETLRPEKATILGPCKVIPQEHLNLTCAGIDVLLPDAGQSTALIDQILDELAVPTNESCVAYRGDQRWVQTFTPTPPPDANAGAARLREGGVYLITGGLGGLGLLLSEHLARTVHAKLVLTARSALPERDEWDHWITAHPDTDATSQKIHTLRALEALGAEVLVCRADAGDLDQMRGAIDQAERRFGPINGVIHAAGITANEHYSAIQATSRDECELHFRSKAHGLIVLEHLLRDRQLDFCLLFSSLAAVLGGLSYVAYAAANLYLDAFAQRQHRSGRGRWISVNWDSWHAQNSGDTVGTVGVTLVELAITPAEGIEAVQRVLAPDHTPQIVVATSDLQARIDQWVKLAMLRGPADAAEAAAPLALTDRGELERRLGTIWQRVLGVAQVNPHDNFFDLGGNSLSGMNLIAELKRELNVHVSPVTLFEAPSISALAKLLMPESNRPSALPRARREGASAAMAIIGMAGRFPGADDIESFWRNLCDGIESVRFFSDEELLAAGVDPALLDDPNYVRARPVLNAVDRFDAGFFGYSPREAELMDPQQRVFLECAWMALEYAGYSSEAARHTIGVYAGSSLSTYLLNLYSNSDLIETIDPLQTVIGNAQDSLATSVSYKLNLKGPSLTVQTFCSTSLVALHLACQSLLKGECDLALAGGVSILVPQENGYRYQEGSILSPDGHSRTFDARAQGTLFGNGVGVVVLKRLEDALADGDTIHAVVKGTAINNDGALKAGYTAPSVDGQATVIAEALAAAGVGAESISYIEAHGTGTTLGDPIEITALTKAFRADTDKSGFCAIGSVKTNVGHLDRAAGIAALIKTTMALKHQQIPPSLHYEQPNPQIDFASSPFYVNTKLADWAANGTPRRAGVSALGFGGTNAHVILEEAPPAVGSGESRPWQVLMLSAKTGSALDAATANLAAYLREHPDLALADVAYTLHVGRWAFSHRRALVCRDGPEAVALLEAGDPQRVWTQAPESWDRGAVFMFSGQGAQYVEMARELYQDEPVFREQLDRCAELLKPHLGLDLREVLYPADDRRPTTHDPRPTTEGRGLKIEDSSADASRELSSILNPPSSSEVGGQWSVVGGRELEQTQYAQPALFAVEYALAQLWMAWGVRPQAMIGHSIGEYVAACLAGVFALEDALVLVAERGRLMQSVPEGAMLAVSLPEAEVRALLGPELALAAINAPDRCVVAGPPEAVAALEARLTAQQAQCRRLHTSHAFHSSMMDGIVEQFRAAVERVRRNPPQMAYISNVTGTWIAATEATDPQYWAAHLRQAVRFGDGVGVLLQTGRRVLLEVGPGQTLTTLARRHPAWTEDQLALASMRHPQDQQPDSAVLLGALSRLWLAGVAIDWEAFYGRQQRHRIPLPAYPFERQSYWIDSGLAGGARQRAQLRDPADWLHVPAWKRTVAPKPGRSAEHAAPRGWLLLTGTDDLSAALTQRLRATGELVTTVQAGAQFRQIDEHTYAVDPRRRADYQALVAGLHAAGRAPTHVVHLWSLSAADCAQCDAGARFEAAQWNGFYSLLFLAQAIDRQRPNAPLHIWAVSHMIHQVHGDEAVRPEQATILAVCRRVTEECPQVICRNLDVVLPGPGSTKLVDQVLAEIAADAPDLIVAYRGNHRWLPIVEQLARDEAEEATTRLHAGGAYLVTGRLDSPAARFAEYMAQVAPVNLLLLDAEGLPAQETWPQWLAPQGVSETIRRDVEAAVQERRRVPFDLAGNLADLAQAATALEQDIEVRRTPPALNRAIDTLCAGYICDYLRSNGIDTGKGATCTREELAARLGILPKFVKLFTFLLGVLAEDGIIRAEGDTITFVEQAGDPATLLGELQRGYPGETEGLAVLDQCVRSYNQVLRGQIDPISVLYPGGSSDLMRAIEDRQAAFSNVRICRALAADLAALIAQQSPGRRLNILEVGAGEGNLTWEVVARLRPYAVDYSFTDIGRSFVLQAEKRAARENLEGMRFGVLDIAQDPIAQGFEPHSFDLILAAEVVHTTSSILDTLANLSKLLAPNGVLCILEATNVERWASMVWGLLDGWWYFSDEDLRRHAPLLGFEGWERVLERRRWQHTHVYPQTGARRSQADYGLLFAQQPATLDPGNAWLAGATQAAVENVQHKIRRAQAIMELGAGVLVARAEPTDSAALQAAVAQAEQRFGAIQGVVHVIDSGAAQPAAPLHAITPESCAGAFQPTIHGFLNIEQALAGRALEVALAISPSVRASNQAVSLADAATAHYLANLAQSLPSDGSIAWTSVHWAAEPDTRLQRELAAFRRLLALDQLPHVVVAPRAIDGEWNTIAALKATEARPQREEALHPRPEIGNRYVAPGDEVEQRLAQIWAEVLGIAQIGIHDSFLELGGDSLQATQLISRVRDAFEIDIPMRAFFETPTVAGLARVIAAARAEQAERKERDARDILALLQRLSPDEIAAELLRRKQTRSNGDEPMLISAAMGEQG